MQKDDKRQSRAPFRGLQTASGIADHTLARLRMLGAPKNSRCSLEAFSSCHGGGDEGARGAGAVEVEGTRSQAGRERTTAIHRAPWCPDRTARDDTATM